MVKGNSRTISRLLTGHADFVRAADEARRYYCGRNRIKDDGSVLQRQAETEQALGSPLHFADNRVAHSWHNLLVTQKVSYALSYPPVFDLESKAANERVREVLGDGYTTAAMQLGIDASNTSVGWLHYWRGADGAFRYHTVDPVQIVPVYSGTLESDLVGVLRCYTKLDPESGQTEQICEYWDDTVCRFYKKSGVSDTYIAFDYPEVGQELRHGMGAVPFIPFYNNANHMGDLPLYRDLIDAYDTVAPPRRGGKKEGQPRFPFLFGLQPFLCCDPGGRNGCAVPPSTFSAPKKNGCRLPWVQKQGTLRQIAPMQVKARANAADFTDASQSEGKCGRLH